MLITQYFYYVLFIWVLLVSWNAAQTNINVNIVEDKSIVRIAKQTIRRANVKDDKKIPQFRLRHMHPPSVQVPFKSSDLMQFNSSRYLNKPPVMIASNSSANARYKLRSHQLKLFTN